MPGHVDLLTLMQWEAFVMSCTASQTNRAEHDSLLAEGCWLVVVICGKLRNSTPTRLIGHRHSMLQSSHRSTQSPFALSVKGDTASNCAQCLSGILDTENGKLSILCRLVESETTWHVSHISSNRSQSAQVARMLR